MGHISSTVIAGSLKLSNTRIEGSTFHGTEPEPYKVDLPLGAPNSYALRLIQDISPTFTAMVSAAYIKNPESHQPDIGYEMRYSASIYNQFRIPGEWRLDNAVIAGALTKYDHASSLVSFAEEFWLHRERSSFWGRFEVLQRTSDELGIASSQPNLGHFVSALTLGYTRNLANFDGVEIGIGGSGTKDLLPEEFIAAYGGNPWTGKVFLQIGGMKMWNL